MEGKTITIYTSVDIDICELDQRQLLTLLGGLLLIFLAVSLVEVIEMPAINRLKLDKNCKSIMINLSYIISIIFRQLKGV